MRITSLRKARYHHYCFREALTFRDREADTRKVPQGYHHRVVTLFYGDGEKFDRDYTNLEKARRFAQRQLKSPIVVKAMVRRLS